MYFIVQMRPRRDTGVSDIPEYLTLLYILPLGYAERLHMRITGIKSMFVFDDDIVAEAGIKVHCDHLTVGCCDNRIAGTVGRKINTLVNIPLSVQRMLVLPEYHGNMTDASADRPQARNIRKQRTLRIQQLPDLFDGLNRILKKPGKLLQFGDFLDRTLRGFPDIEEGRQVAIADIALCRCGGRIKPDERERPGKRILKILCSFNQVAVSSLSRSRLARASLLSFSRRAIFCPVTTEFRVNQKNDAIIPNTSTTEKITEKIVA